MKKILLSGLMSITLLFLSTLISAQTPTVTWDKFFPSAGEYEVGNYTANEIKQSPVTTGYVLVGSRRMTWKGNGYNEVMVMRIDKDGGSIGMNNIFTGTSIYEIYEDGVYVTDTIPWDQVADEEFPEGLSQRTWYPGTLAPGTYIIQLESLGMVSVRKLVLAR